MQTSNYHSVDSGHWHDIYGVDREQAIHTYKADRVPELNTHSVGYAQSVEVSPYSAVERVYRVVYYFSGPAM